MPSGRMGLPAGKTSAVHVHSRKKIKHTTWVCEVAEGHADDLFVGDGDVRVVDVGEGVDRALVDDDLVRDDQGGVGGHLEGAEMATCALEDVKFLGSVLWWVVAEDAAKQKNVKALRVWCTHVNVCKPAKRTAHLLA